jgi:hypothetical protein
MEPKTMDKQVKSSLRRKIPAYLQKMTLAEKAANDKIVERMEKQTNFLKNPRTNLARPPLTFQQVIYSISHYNSRAPPPQPRILKSHSDLLQKLSLLLTTKSIQFMKSLSPSQTQVEYRED